MALVVGLLAILLVPIAGVAAFVVGLLSVLDWRRRRLERRLFSRSSDVAAPVRVEVRRDGSWHDARGPVVVDAPTRVWSPSFFFVARIRRRPPRGAIVEVDEGARDIVTGDYRAATRRSLSSSPGNTHVDVFYPSRAAVAAALSNVLVTRGAWIFLAVVVPAAVAIASLCTVIPFGMG